MSSPPQKAKARPYRDFLTPSLHRRFTGAALWSMLGCYGLALWWSSWSPFWSWFPVGPTGIRTLALFICPLCVYVLRVGNIHVGSLTTNSPFEMFSLLAVRAIPLQVFAWYLLSALCFCEVSIWTASDDARLDMINHGRSYERSRLNERPIFLRAMFGWAAFCQALVHLYFDDDRMALPITFTSEQKRTWVRLRETVVPRLPYLPWRLLVPGASGVFVYFLFLRRLAFSVQYFIASSFYRIPKTRSSGVPDLMSLIGRYVFHSLLLLLLWDLANAVSSIYLSKSPLKRGQPLTNDSKDPNGSLLLGLKGKKEFPRNMAFWELLLITRNFEARRQTIFTELDRQGGNTWSQICNVCLAEIRTIVTRIEGFNRPASPPPQPQPEIKSLPRLSQPLKDDNVFTNEPLPTRALDGAFEAFGDFAKAHGKSPGADPFSPIRGTLENGMNKLKKTSALQKALPVPESSKVHGDGGVLGRILRSPVGWPFRQSFARRAASVVCGSPMSRTGTVTAAIDNLTQLITVSLKEDRYGCVQKDVVAIFRCFTSSIQAIQGFLRTLPPHWTDVQFREGNRKEAHEVNEMLRALTAGLEGLLMVYGEYLEGLGATGQEVKNAKAMVAQGKPVEMIEKK